MIIFLNKSIPKFLLGHIIFNEYQKIGYTQSTGKVLIKLWKNYNYTKKKYWVVPSRDPYDYEDIKGADAEKSLLHVIRLDQSSSQITREDSYC